MKWGSSGGTYNGILGQAYCKKYGVSVKDYDRGMMELCRTRRLHGSLNPKAFIQETLEAEAKRLKFDDVSAFWGSRLNPFISWPARIRSVVTPADGASAILLTRSDLAKNAKNAPVSLMGYGSAVSDLPWYADDPTDWKVDRLAVERAYAMAGISGEDINYLHTHDCSFIMSLCTAEATGYLKPGSDTYEAVKQIRGQAGKRQMPKRPKIAVVGTQGYAIISTMLVLKGN